MTAEAVALRSFCILTLLIIYKPPAVFDSVPTLTKFVFLLVFMLAFLRVQVTIRKRVSR
jgi:hypothetical protein